MIDSYLEQPHSRPLLTGRDPENIARGAPVLVFLFALLAGMLASGPPLHAEEQASTKPRATVNINADDAGTLAAGLKGVGQARAVEIIRHREAYGPFESVEELAEVKGIGESTVAKNRKLITLD